MNKKIYKLLLRLYLALVLIFIIPGHSFATNTSVWRQSDEQNPTTINHTQWQQLLNKYLIAKHPSGVNRFRYGAVSAAEKQVLQNYLNAIQKLDPRQYPRSEQKAYWINLYNALTVNLILDNYPVKSIKKIGKKLFSFGPWDDEIAKVAEKNLTLNDIEHKILRPIWKDPRIHYAVNCASYGCPNLSGKAYTSANIEELLENGAKSYVNHPRGVSFNNGNLKVSSIYHWYKKDFGDSDQQLIVHLKRYAKPELKQNLDNVKGSIDHDYNWSLNDAR